MRKAGQVVLFRFPQTDLKRGKLRPALLLGILPGVHNIRVGRLAVVEGSVLRGTVGEISEARLNRLKQNLAGWLTQS